jgi:hypothetical protein
VKTPDTSGIRSADRTCKKDIEGGQVSRIGGIRSKQVIGRKSCSMERAMVSCETAKGFRILKAVSELALTPKCLLAKRFVWTVCLPWSTAM